MAVCSSETFVTSNENKRHQNLMTTNDIYKIWRKSNIRWTNWFLTLAHTRRGRMYLEAGE
jgi:hypothetical protein